MLRPNRIANISSGTKLTIALFLVPVGWVPFLVAAGFALAAWVWCIVAIAVGAFQLFRRGLIMLLGGDSDIEVNS